MVNNIGGYLYWLLIAPLVGPEGASRVTTIVNVLGVVGALLNLDLSYAVLREAARDWRKFWASLLVSSCAGLLSLLSICIPLRALTMNLISLLNYERRLRQILLLGTLQLFIIIAGPCALVPLHGLLGAGITLVARDLAGGAAALISLRRHVNCARLLAGPSLASLLNALLALLRLGVPTRAFMSCLIGVALPLALRLLRVSDMRLVLLSLAGLLKRQLTSSTVP